MRRMSGFSRSPWTASCRGRSRSCKNVQAGENVAGWRITNLQSPIPNPRPNNNNGPETRAVVMPFNAGAIDARACDHQR